MTTEHIDDLLKMQNGVFEHNTKLTRTYAAMKALEQKIPGEEMKLMASHLNATIAYLGEVGAALCLLTNILLVEDAVRKTDTNH